MKTILVTGAGGLIGSEACKRWLDRGDLVVGLDDNSRMTYFGPEGDVSKVIEDLTTKENFRHVPASVADRQAVFDCFKSFSFDVVVHCAAQPSHDKATSIPLLDFDVNAVGTMNVLQAAKELCSKDVVVIHMSTNKVYGDGPNRVLVKENKTRYDYVEWKYRNGIDETFGIDQCLHSFFGASKAAADVLAQEFGRYHGMNVGVFRAGCVTGPMHASVELHGFLSYIVKCAVEGRPYRIIGYKGKQVRDQIHSIDMVNAFDRFIDAPRQGEVYNIGGGRENSASILEIVELIEELSGHKLQWDYEEVPRKGDHICYITDLSKLKSHYPGWEITVGLRDIVAEMISSRKGTSVV